MNSVFFFRAFRMHHWNPGNRIVPVRPRPWAGRGPLAMPNRPVDGAEHTHASAQVSRAARHGRAHHLDDATVERVPGHLHRREMDRKAGRQPRARD